MEKHEEAKLMDTGVKSLSEETEGTEEFKNQIMGSSQERPAQRDNSYPSSLRSTSTCTTYSLEISTNTVELPMSLHTPSGTCETNPELENPQSTANTPETSSHRPADQNPPQKKDQKVEEFNQCQEKLSSCKIGSSSSPGTKSCFNQNFVSNPHYSMKPEAQPFFDNEPSNREESEEFFYSFVILHAPEDTQEAIRLKKRLEFISSTTGATFSEDFSDPGRSTFRCVEDAIENSAFVILLLTPNFKSCLSETSMDSALFNSIEKPHKYNTVVPLLPRTNGLARQDMSLILKSKNPLRETDSDTAFEMQVRKMLSPGRLCQQKSIWVQEQRTKKLQEKRRRIQEENRRLSESLQEAAHVQRLEEQRRCLQTQVVFQPDTYWPQEVAPNLWHPQPSCINIQNAKYIMIGNSSTMTVGAAGDSDADDL